MRKGTCNYKLLNAYKEFGEPILEIIEECKLEELNKLEALFIEKFNAINNGFNILKGSTTLLHGEDTLNSKYPNTKILEVFELLVGQPSLSYPEIAIITGVPKSTIVGIACSSVHTWIKEVYPDKYQILEGLRSNRPKYGEYAGSSKYLNSKIVEVFTYLVDQPSMSLIDISNLTEVKIGTVRSISRLENHTWLKEEFPEKYLILEALKGTRKKSNSKTAKDMGIVYPLVVSPVGTIFSIGCLRAFAREHLLDVGSLSKLLRGIAKSHKGWKVKN